jgi:N-acetylglucosaminyldiphosphoundecaprenol N-acetyl-beta-D-mannosaminyltransferase
MEQSRASDEPAVSDTPCERERVREPVLGVLVDVLDWTTAVERICGWAQRRESRYVSICDAHSIVCASRDPQHGRHIADADMVTPDGWPVAAMLRRFGHPQQQRINGPDLMERLLVEAELRGLRVYVYGTTDRTLAALKTALMAAYPNLNIVGMHSPPFRPLSEAEDAADIARIHASGAHLVMTGLGCPKEDHWMFAHRGRVQAVVLGIGAGIDFHAGTVARAPAWMRDHGLEWFFRLTQEPGRLWKRYLINNTLFVVGALGQFARRALGQNRWYGACRD